LFDSGVFIFIFIALSVTRRSRLMRFVEVKPPVLSTTAGDVLGDLDVRQAIRAMPKNSLVKPQKVEISTS